MSERFAKKVLILGKTVHSKKSTAAGAPPTSYEFWAKDVDDEIILITALGVEYKAHGEKCIVPWSNIREVVELDGVPEKVAAMTKKSGNDSRGARQ